MTVLVRKQFCIILGPLIRYWYVSLRCVHHICYIPAPVMRTMISHDGHLTLSDDQS